MKPKILFSGSRSGQENYENAISQAGGVPVPGYCPEADLSCDGLLLCGGGDADPSLYGREDCGSRDIDRDRDRAELALIGAFAAAGKPILAICRGHQMVNIALGGTLIQDLPAHLRPFHVREGADKVHPVCAAPGSFFAKTYGPVFAVNSAHRPPGGGPAPRAVVGGRGGRGHGARIPAYPLRPVPPRADVLRSAPAGYGGRRGHFPVVHIRGSGLTEPERRCCRSGFQFSYPGLSRMSENFFRFPERNQQ